FLEGTRFTPAKHDQQQSPFRHLLKPKAGGIAFVLDAMGEQLESMVDVTIHYPAGRPTFWDLLCGRVPQVVMRVRKREIPARFLGRSYDSNAEYPDVPAVGEPAVAGKGRGAGAAQAAVSRLTPPLGWSGTALAPPRPAAGSVSLSQITSAASQRLSTPSTSTTPSVMASRSSGRNGRRSTRCWGLLRYSFTRRWSSAFRRLAMTPS